jgi:hypothetical protein
MVRDAEAFWPFLLGRRLKRQRKLQIDICKGTYSCVAKDFALMQTRAVIARIVMAYDLSFTGPEDFEQSGKDRYIMVYGLLLVKFTPKKGPGSNNSAEVSGREYKQAE